MIDIDTAIYADDAILQNLASTEDEWARGASLYGRDGLFDALRKVLLDTTALQIRDSKSEKVTEAWIAQAAHADKEYGVWLDGHVVTRANWLALDAKRSRWYAELKSIQARGFDARRNGA